MCEATPQLEAALDVIGALRHAGYQAYLAGGCVRDLLLGRAPSDYDVATSATPDVVLALFPRTFAVGAHFGVVLVAHDYGESYFTTEVATFRSDGVYSDGRHPDAVRYTLSAEEDVKRRDFTINGLLLDPEKMQFEAAHPGDKNKDVARVGHPAGVARSGLSSPARLQPAHPEGVASGHDFSRADSAQQEAGALAPATAHEAPNRIPQGLKPSADEALSARLKSCPDTGPAQSSASAGPGLHSASPALRSAILDFVGGVADLEAGVVRAIGNPQDRFEEDHLRMLRAVRFAARFGFELESATKKAIRPLAHKTAAVSRERVRDELTKMLTEGHARRAFELLDETGLLADVLPEIARMKGVEQPPQYHPEGDVWVHTLGLLAQLDAGCAPTLAWGALLHDIGKPATFRRAPDRIRFDGHVEVGVAIAADMLRGFRFSNEDTQQILALVDNHMRFADAHHMRASTLKRFFRLNAFDQHLALHRMDCMAGSGNLDHWNFVRERWQAMPEETVRPTPLITGRELIAAGYAPGPAFKPMLRAVEDAQLDGLISTADEALQWIRERYSLA